MAIKKKTIKELEAEWDSNPQRKTNKTTKDLEAEWDSGSSQRSAEFAGKDYNIITKNLPNYSQSFYDNRYQMGGSSAIKDSNVISKFGQYGKYAPIIGENLAAGKDYLNMTDEKIEEYVKTMQEMARESVLNRNRATARVGGLSSIDTTGMKKAEVNALGRMDNLSRRDDVYEKLQKYADQEAFEHNRGEIFGGMSEKEYLDMYTAYLRDQRNQNAQQAKMDKWQAGADAAVAEAQKMPGYEELSKYVPDEEYLYPDMGLLEGNGFYTTQSGEDISAGEYRKNATDAFLAAFVDAGNDPEKRRQIEFSLEMMPELNNYNIEAIPYMTEDQKGAFFARWNSGDRDGAKQMLKTLDYGLQAERVQTEQAQIAQDLENANWAEKALYSIGTVPQNLLNEAVGATQALAGIFNPKGLEDLHEYSAVYDAGREAQMVRGEIGQDIADATDYLTIPGTDINIPRMAYNAIMSSADSTANAFLFGGAGAWAPTLAMGSGAFANEYMNSQDYWDALVSMGIEAGTEYLPFDIMGNKAMKPGTKILSGMLAEGLGESTAEALNIGYDVFKNVENSEAQQNIDMLISQGYTPQDALRETVKKYGLEVLESGLTGALSGAGSNAPSAIQANIENRNWGKNIVNNEGADALMDLADTLPVNDQAKDIIRRMRAENAEKGKGAKAEAVETDTAAVTAEDVEASTKAAEKTARDRKEMSGRKKGEKAVKNAEVGYVYREVMRTVDAEAQNVVANTLAGDVALQLSESGFTGDVKKAARDIVNFISGKTDRQTMRTIEGSSEARRIALEYTAPVDRMMRAAERRSRIYELAGDVSQRARKDFVKPEATKAEKGAEEATKGIEDRAVITAADVEIADTPESTVDGKAVTIEGVANVSDIGTVTYTVRDSEGNTREVSEDDVSIGQNDAVTAVLVENARELGRNADAMIRNYVQGQDVQAYAEAFKQALQYGEDGRNLDVVKGYSDMKALNEGQIATAYEIGRGRRTFRNTRMVRKNTAGVKVGNVDTNQINMHDLNAAQLMSVRSMSSLAKAVGFNLKFVESKADAEGRYTTENGSWDPETLTLTLDVHAGSNMANDKNYAIMHTAGHELTHYIKQFADGEMWNAYQEFVIGHLSTKDGKGFDLENAITAHIKTAREQGRYLDRDAAIEEVIANASGDALNKITETDLSALAQDNPGLFNKIKEFFSKWISILKKTISAAYKGAEARTEEAQQMMDAVNEMGRRWNELLLNATKNRRESAKGENVASEATTTAEAEAPRSIGYRHIDQRTFDSVKEEDTELFASEVDEAQVGMAAAAKILLADLENSIPGQKVWLADNEVTGQKRQTSALLGRMKDELGLTWDKLRQNLMQFSNMDELVEGEVKLPRNSATNRRIELYLNEMLTKGYTALDGTRINPWDEYFNAISGIEGAEPQKKYSTTRGAVDFVDYAWPGEVKYSPRRTKQEIANIQAIGEKSVNDFDSDDIKKTSALAQQYFKEMGTKSPFFKAWFGDWRANDTSPVLIANTIGKERGEVSNVDTGWKIQVSGKVFNETKSHNGVVNTEALPYLDYINDIVKKAVLLDTFTMRVPKSENSVLMHNMYAIADIGNGAELMKLYVEEMNDVNKDGTAKRAYQLQNIEKQPLTVKGSGKSLASAQSTAAIRSVADLHRIVKAHGELKEAKSVNTELINTDGTPKVMYHQTENDFYIFDTRHKGGGTRDNETPFGIFLKETDRDIGLNGKKQMALYAKIVNPLIVQTREELVQKLRELSEEYGRFKDIARKIDAEYGEKVKEAQNAFKNYLIQLRETGAKNGTEPKSRKDLYKDPEFNRLFYEEDRLVDEWTEVATANDLIAKEAITNTLKKHGYDGIILRNDVGSYGRKTEAYIALEPTQVKSARDNIGTFDSANPDIRYQSRDLSNLSDRELLVRALETDLNAEERGHLESYKAKMDKLSEDQRKLEALNSEIVQLRQAGKTQKNSEELRKAMTNATTLRGMIDETDAELNQIESAAMIKEIVRRNRVEASRSKATSLREWQEKEKYRKMLGSDAKSLYKWIANPTNKGSVPEFLRKPLGEFIEAFDFSSEKALKARDILEEGDRDKIQKWQEDLLKKREEAKARYDKATAAFNAIKDTGEETEIKRARILMLRAKSDYEVEADAFERGIAGAAAKYTKRDKLMTEALDHMREAIETIGDQQSDIDGGAQSFMGYIDLPANFIQNFRENISNIKRSIEAGGYQKSVPVNRMTAAQVRELAQSMRVLKSSIIKVNTFVSNAQYSSVKTAADGTINDMNELRARRKTNKALEVLNTTFNWKNTTPYYAFQRMGRGAKAIFESLQDGWDKMAQNSATVIEFSRDTFTAKESRTWAKEISEVKLDNGETIQMTTAQKMSLYCLSKRPQAIGHLLGGGIRVADIEGKRGGKISQAENYTLTLDDIGRITGSLTDRQKEVADALQRFMSDQCAKWGNEISMKRFGFNQMTELFYFPIETDSNNRARIDETKDGKNSMFRLLNMSSLKPLTPNANNAIVIHDIFDVFAGHASDMAKYNALALPILDFIKWYNHVERTEVRGDDGKTTGQITTRSTQKALERAFGQDAKSYLTAFIKDLNAEHDGGRNDGLINSIVGRAKSAAVGWNLRVYGLQITSLPRAAYAINPVYLVKGLAKVKSLNPVNAIKGTEAQQKVGILKWKDLGFYSTDISRSTRDMIKRNEGRLDKLRDWQMAAAGWGDNWVSNIIYEAAKAEMKAKNPEIKPGSAEYDRRLNKRVREIVYKTQVVDSTMTRSEMMRSKGLASTVTAFMSEPTLTVNMLNESIQKAVETGRKGGNVRDVLRASGGMAVRAASTWVFTSVVTTLMESVFDALRDDDEYETFLQKFWSAIWGDKWYNGNAVQNLNPITMFPILNEAWSIMVEGYEDNSLITQVFSQFRSFFDAIGSYQKGNTTLYNVIYKGAQTVSSMSGHAAANAARDGVSLYNTFLAPAWGTPKLQTYADNETTAAKAYYEAIKAGDTERAEYYRERMEVTGMDMEKVEKKIATLAGDDYVAGSINAKVAKNIMVSEGAVDAEDLDDKIAALDFEKKAGFAYGSMKEKYTEGIIDRNKAINYIMEYEDVERAAAQVKVNKWQYEIDTKRSYSDLKKDYVAGRISNAQLRKYLKEVELLDEEKIEERVSNYDYYAYKGKDSAPKYWRLAYTYETGGDYEAYADEIFKEIMDTGKSWKQARSSIASSLASYYKKDYLAVKGTAAGDRMLEQILDVYEAIGYDRAYERKYIAENWELED